MPLFSAFTPFNMWKFSGAPSRGESVYRSMCAAKSKAFDLTKGSYQEAKVYSQAMGIARGRYALERAQNQLNPFKCIELLPNLEKDWAVIPSETDTLLDRQAAVAAKMILVRGARREALEDGLTSILGSNFIALRETTNAEALVYTSSSQNFSRPDIQGKYVQLTSPVTVSDGATPFEVSYSAATANDPVVIQKGDTLTIQPENIGLKEVVTVTSARTGYFTAVYTNPHDVGAYVTSANYVDWMSTKRTFYVIVNANVVLNTSIVRRVNEFMSRACRGLTNWHIVQPTTPGATTIGPFTLDVSPIGAVPIGTLNILVNDLPEVGAVIPAFGPASGGTSAILYGRSFTGATDVKVDGVSVSFSILDDYSISFTTLAHTRGTFDISVTTSFGTGTGVGLFRFDTVFTSITPNLGDTVGGIALSLSGAGFTGITSVSIGGIACSSFTVASDISITCNSPALVAGTYDVNLLVGATTVATLPAAFESWNPTVEAPSLIYAQNAYNGGLFTWTNSGSGSSGNAITASNAPTQVGTGYPSFDGVNDILKTTADFSTFIANGTGSFVIFFYADSAAAAAANTYDDPPLVCDDNGDFNLGYSNSGLGIAFYDGAWKQQRITASVTTWHMAKFRWNGSNLEIGLDAGAMTSLAAGNFVPNAGSKLTFGQVRISATKFFNGKLRYVAAKGVTWSDAVMTKFYTWGVGKGLFT